MIDTNIADMRPLNRFLKMAVVAGVESAVRIHIDRGDDLNARDGNGLTPLMLSAARNKFTICKLLLDAGANKGLLAPSGKTAHAIAVDAGAHEAASILMPVIFPIDTSDRSLPNVVPSPREACSSPGNPAVEPPLTFGATNRAEDIALLNIQIDIKEDELETGLEFDLSGWEPEEDMPPPAVDPSVAQAASTLQESISKHEPIDSSEDWEDIDLYLPERSMPLARTGDAETRELLRALLLRAYREGSVPRASLEALSLNDDQSENPEAEALLTMVINDLGAEVDERLEYVSSNENFEVFVKPEENPDEEEIVADTLAFIDNVTSRYSEPLRIYQKEFQRERLISADEEVELGKAMEVELERALDVLATWPRGISLALAAGSMIKSKQKPLTWLSRGPTEAQPDLESEPDSESDAEMAGLDQSDEEVESDEDSQFDVSLPLGDFASEFSDAVDRLASLPIVPAQRGAQWQAVRDTLSSLRLNRRFLLELADAEPNGNPGSAAFEYNNAMKAYQAARERMAAANLKLVFHLAKKYLYSGEPLDDLAQEGNIGLLKAIERYDWRRGFKFSTYATWWIRQQIGRHVADKGRTIRVPVHVYEKTQRLTRETLALESEIGREPNLNEVATRMEMSARKVSALLSIAPEPLPIHDLPIDEMIAVDAQSDFVSPDPFDIALKSEVHKTIGRVLATLKPREEQIIRLRYGIGVGDSLTLDDIGQRYEVTRERIRQIEAKAIRKLMQPSRIDALSSAFFGYLFPKEEVAQDAPSQPSEAAHSQEANQIHSDASAIHSPAITTSPAKASSIDRLIEQATGLGISIVDERIGTTGKIWINFIDIPDDRYRKLTRKLMALGFEFMLGKGYWK
ncbi:sigma-70 family RNA polymerase sigma factor [Janthinobacterium sp. MDT1-19]|uniref:sigma-70 family RNA polymerase sigma factor n=1 Tax=Janthinobacterium sp. MDT1-19 TaxID=1259339 RepID=UPI003F22D8C6